VTVVDSVSVCDPLVADPLSVMVCDPTGVPPVSTAGPPHAVIVAAKAMDARSTKKMGHPLRNRRHRRGMRSRNRLANPIAPTLPAGTEAVVEEPGAVVCTSSVEDQLAPLTTAGEKEQVVLAGNWAQLRATGRLKPVPGTTVMV